jgi:uncharacterized protein (DUF488 family)
MINNKLPQFYRQRFILALLHVFGKKLHKTDFQKYLFLYQQEYPLKNQQYFFLPYKYGPFSFQAYADLRRMQDLGYLKNDESIELSDDVDYVAYLKDEDKLFINELYDKYKNIKGKDLIKNVYTRYPYFALKSKIKNEFSIDQNFENYKKNSFDFFTKGYEGSTIDQYLNSIISNDIKLVIDVRKNPISMKFGFSKRTLEKALSQVDIEYKHLPELGIQTEDRQNLKTYENYQALFNHYEKTTLLQQKNAIQKIYDIFINKKRIVLTCFEKDYNYCHRSRISNYIQNKYNIKVTHI